MKISQKVFKEQSRHEHADLSLKFGLIGGYCTYPKYCDTLSTYHVCPEI